MGILVCLWLMLNLTVLTWLRFAWMAAGVLIYWVWLFWRDVGRILGVPAAPGRRVDSG